ncbi:MAG TPA: hypothetical protein DIT05_08185 [Morganella sp. (in: Bacteria)]|nr:hypothetical protein [Morganella sp. (in: enterobacteria)]
MYFQQANRRETRMERITGQHESRSIQRRRAVFQNRVLQLLGIISWPLQYTVFILSGCFLLDLCFDLPGHEVKYHVKLLVSWWQESGAENLLVSFRH